MRWTACVLAGVLGAAGLAAACARDAERSEPAPGVASTRAPQAPPPAAAAAPLGAAHVDAFTGNPRLFVLTDMGNEPDDQMSFVRLLVYSNEIDIEGLVATTSTWQRAAVHPETMRALIAAYGEARPNLLKHASGWPEGAHLDSLVASGQPAYGMAAVGEGKTSAGAELLIRAGDREDPRPLWVSVWGGANTLAQALLHLRATRSPAEVERFVGRLRVYSISDQDDAGPWIRREFPTLFYVVKPSSPDGAEYYTATWTGISGDPWYHNCDGSDVTTVTNEWLDANVRSKGPLGKHYPKYMFIMEGDTPAYLGLTNNGLNSYRNPGWGGWSGRYVLRTPYGETRPIWTQGGDAAGVSSRDEVMGTGGQRVLSDQATIWRWRQAFQHDFAARMDWSVKAPAEANHNPAVVVNGQEGTAVVEVATTAGQPLILDARGTTDPDGQPLRYAWFHYPEAAGPTAPRVQVKIDAADTPRATVTVNASGGRGGPPGADVRSPVAHVILAVADSGSPSLTSYRRVILTVSPSAPAR